VACTELARQRAPTIRAPLCKHDAKSDIGEIPASERGNDGGLEVGMRE